jgi:hypothetical protein
VVKGNARLKLLNLASSLSFEDFQLLGPVQVNITGPPYYADPSIDLNLENSVIDPDSTLIFQNYDDVKITTLNLKLGKVLFNKNIYLKAD